MGRFTKIALPTDFIDYSKKLPETLLLAAINQIDKGVAENDALSSAITKNLNIRIAPSEESQKTYKSITDSFSKEKNDIVEGMLNNPMDYSKHKARLSVLANKISDNLTFGQLKALKEQGDSYYNKLSELANTYKDTPELYSLARKKLDENLNKNTYNSELNTYGQLEEPKMVEHHKVDAIQKYFTNMLAAVAVEENMTENDIKRIIRTPAVDVYALDGKDRKAYEKIRKVFSGIPKTFIDSLNQDHEARNNIDADGKLIDENTFMNLDGSFNLDTELGKLAYQYSTAGTQNKVDILQVSRNAGGNGGVRVNVDMQDEVQYHPWAINPDMNKLIQFYNNAQGSDKSTAGQQIMSAVHSMADQLRHADLWKNTTEFKEGNGVIYPFTRGYPYLSDGKTPNAFQDNFIRVDFNTNKIYVKDPAANSLELTSTALLKRQEILMKQPQSAERDRELAKIQQQNAAIKNKPPSYVPTDIPFNMDNVNDMKRFADYLYTAGFQQTLFVPVLKGGFDMVKLPEQKN